MSPRRSLTALTFTVTAGALLAALPTPALTLLGSPHDIVGWWELHGTATATIGLLHALALGVFAYVALVLAAATLAEAARLPRAAASIARLAPRTVRRYVLVGAVTGMLITPSMALAQEPIVVVDVGTAAPPPASITVTDLGPAVEQEEPAHQPAAAMGPTQAAPATTFHEGFRARSSVSVPDAWLVERGDNLWSIAASVVADRGDTADEATIARYWSSLIHANADALDDPDLIHPGQVLTLPPLITAGS